MLKRLFGQTSWYLAAHLIGMALGLVTFPIWTRYFSVEEIGMLGLIDATVLFVAPFIRLGVRRSVVRFYSEFKTGKRAEGMQTFFSTFIFGSFGLSLIGGTLFILVIVALGPERTGGDLMYTLWRLAGVLIILGAVPGIYMTIIRMEEKARYHTILGLSGRFFAFFLTLTLIFVFTAGIKSLYIASIAMQVGMVSLMFYMMWRQKRLAFKAFSLAFLWESIKFSFPLVPAELANEISGIGDRYVIGYFLTVKEVGLYSIGYGATGHLKAFLTVMMFAVAPMYLSIWEESGRKKTEEFLSKVLDYYLLLAVPGILFFMVYGGDFLVLLASSKYEATRPILPYLAIPLVLHGAITIYTAGLYIHKKTNMVLVFTACAGVLNIVLNILMVPFMGIVGAALATLISYLALILMANIFSSRYLTIRLFYGRIAKYILSSALAIAVIQFIELDAIYAVVIKVACGCLIYGVTMLIIDLEIRQKLRQLLKI